MTGLAILQQTEIFDLFPANPAARFVLLALIVLFGWQSKGIIAAWREDKRTKEHDEIDLVQMVETLTSAKLSQMATELVEERTARQALERRALRLERRVGQLEIFVESKELTPPPWPKEWH